MAETVVRGKRDQLGDRMKSYEHPTNTFLLDDTKPFIVRLDGHHFSRFLTAFDKPKDPRIHRAMVRTTYDLVLQFKPSTAFTCSDEITLVFPVDDVLKKVVDMPFGGRIVKISTILSGLASSSFYKHLTAEVKTAPNLLRHIEKTMPHFDARAFSVPENYELINNIKWRHLFDYRRNSISGLAQRHFSYKVLHGLHSEQLKEKLLEKGIDWNSELEWYKWGVFVKLEKFKTLVWIGKKQGESQPVQKVVTKNRPVTIIKELQKKYNPEDENFILSSYLDGTDKEVVGLNESEEEEDTNDNEKFELKEAEEDQPKPILSYVNHTFRWPHKAGSVKIAGTFNQWTQEPMQCSGNEFFITMALLPDNYQYKFIVDNVWKHDPNKANVDDTLGGKNNVVNIRKLIK